MGDREVAFFIVGQGGGLSNNVWREWGVEGQARLVRLQVRKNNASKEQFSGEGG